MQLQMPTSLRSTKLVLGFSRKSPASCASNPVCARYLIGLERFEPACGIEANKSVTHKLDMIGCSDETRIGSILCVGPKAKLWLYSIVESEAL